jgi:hypothetical protein
LKDECIFHANIEPSTKGNTPTEWNDGLAALSQPFIAFDRRRAALERTSVSMIM